MSEQQDIGAPLAAEQASRRAPEIGAPAYRVLARKYRPTTFEHLIGQDAMVQTLENAFASGRIAQAYMLTGVRGIGKTTTARLIARALNYSESAKPTVRLPSLGIHCAAILESRHPDVIEMDAASRTGVDDIRELIEGVRYRPIDARYKVYIIDEVHMLSKAAFNALLKTLEEPPEHVKFIFATTEVRKVPVTVLSRCQRFDLKRLDSELLLQHFRNVAGNEGVSAEDEALALIARASEGSVRDGLSLLDQAIAYGGDVVRAEAVRAMLGLADRGRTIDLFEALMQGDAAAALAQLKQLYDFGAEPVTILTDLAELTHWITRLKVVPDAAKDPARAEVERVRGISLAERLSMAVLTRAWQMLLKGIEEVNQAAHSLAAAEMVVIRMAYAADLPTVREVLEREGTEASSSPEHRGAPGAGVSAGADAVTPMRRPSSGGAMRAEAPVSPTASTGRIRETMAAAAPALVPAVPPAAAGGSSLSHFRDVVRLAGERRDIKLKSQLESYVRPVRVGGNQVEIGLEPGAPPGLTNELSRKLEQWTGERWVVSVSRDAGERPLAEQDRLKRDTLFNEARGRPVVQALLERFPGAEIVDVRDLSVQEDAVAAPDMADDETMDGNMEGP
ncbi:DNA polymerase III subunit gamma/tau [Rhodoligotrophos defluvii]|uniref:DNA polymerase III subunit gamma/tau n=1 Tax=Rhodoligotrophos defluvii TaxID=2561934 RepID=UPI001EF02E72|nr:DNA polymerase III subunit gamma/tau [Rhodoligotrophos defluvii]